MIPYGHQHIDETDINAVVEVLKSDWLTQGPTVNRFEEAVAHYCGARYGVAAANATCSLHLACLALGVTTGDVVWTTPNTFLASANCARYCGAEVDFVDICPRSYNLSVTDLAAKLEEAKLKNKLPKVVIPVHFAGQSCDMKGIKKLADHYGFKIIEDASHAIGGTYCGERVGNCRYSDITIFSFHPVKIITTGEGGLALTNQQELAKKMALLRSHGMTRDPDLMDQPSEGAWYYQQVNLGFNYRITDLQCALGLSQLSKIDSFVKQRHVLVAHYNNLLKELPVILPWQSPESYSAFHLYVIQIDQTRTHKTRKEVFDALRAANIGVNVHYIPVHLQPYYRKRGFKAGEFPAAEHYYHHAMTLPLYSELKLAEQNYIASHLKTALIEK